MTATTLNAISANWAAGVVLEQAKADPDIPGQNQIEERRHAHRPRRRDIEDEQQPELWAWSSTQRDEGRR